MYLSLSESYSYSTTPYYFPAIPGRSFPSPGYTSLWEARVYESLAPGYSFPVVSIVQRFDPAESLRAFQSMAGRFVDAASTDHKVPIMHGLIYNNNGNIGIFCFRYNAEATREAESDRRWRWD